MNPPSCSRGDRTSCCSWCDPPQSCVCRPSRFPVSPYDTWRSSALHLSQRKSDRASQNKTCTLIIFIPLPKCTLTLFSLTGSSFYGTAFRLQRSRHQLRPYCTPRISLDRAIVSLNPRTDLKFLFTYILVVLVFIDCFKLSVSNLFLNICWETVLYFLRPRAGQWGSRARCWRCWHSWWWSSSWKWWSTAWTQYWGGRWGCASPSWRWTGSGWPHQSAPNISCKLWFLSMVTHNKSSLPTSSTQIILHRTLLKGFLHICHRRFLGLWAVSHWILTSPGLRYRHGDFLKG